MRRKEPELPMVSHRFYIACMGLLQRLCPTWQSSELPCQPPGQMRPLSLGSPGSLPGMDIAAAIHQAHGCHPAVVVVLSQLGVPPETQAVTMPPSSLQEGAKSPVPKSLTVVDSLTGGVSDPSDEVGSSCGQVGMVSIDPDLIGWEI